MKNKIKLYYITNSRVPTEKAHGLQIIKMCEAFSSQGAEVELVLPRRVNPNEGDIFEFYNIQKTFKIKKLFCLDTLSLKKSGKLGFIIQYASFVVSVLFYFLFNYKKFSNSILYLRDEISARFLSLFNKNVYLELHGFNVRYERDKNFFIKRVGGLVLITQKVKEEFLKLGVSKEKIVVAADAVDLKIFDIEMSREEARRVMNLPPNKIIIGYTGRFKTMGMDKGINDILKAITLLKNKEIIFVAVGGSVEDIEYYQEIVDKLNITSQVIILGYKKQTELAIYQKACDILLMPFPFNEHYAYYMSPLKMFEYMAAKRPIISSDLPSVRDVFNEDNCLFCRPGDAGDLRQKIELLIENKELSQRISQKAYSEIENYTWGRRAGNITNFIIKNRQ